MNDEEIKKLKKDLKRTRAERDIEAKRAESFKLYAMDLEAKLQVALDRLRLVTSNSYYSNEGQSTNDASYNMQITASRGLKIIGAMKARKP